MRLVANSTKRRAIVLSGLVLLCVLGGLIYHRWRHRSERFPAFSQADMASWRSYGGDWQLHDGIYSNRADGRGDKLVGGPTEWGDYSVSADIRFDTAPQDTTYGDAGLMLRVLDASIGVDAMRAYYAALRMDDHMLVIGAMAFQYHELATTSFPHEMHTGRWYHLIFSSRGCVFHLRAEDTVTGEAADVSYVEQTCDPRQGQVGLRSYYAKASWRDLHVQLLH